MWSTLGGGRLMKVVNLTGFTVFSFSFKNLILLPVMEDGMFGNIFKEIHTLGYRTSIFNFVIKFKIVA